MLPNRFQAQLDRFSSGSGGLQAAIELATIAHEGQLDKCGMPYITHPMRVMYSVMMELRNESHATVCVHAMAAVLHDVVEDTDVTLFDLDELRVSAMVVDAVDALTRQNGPDDAPPESYKDYISRVARNPVARLVKVHDIQDNLREPFPFGDSMRNRMEESLALLLWDLGPGR